MEAIHRAVENKRGPDLERLAHHLKGSVVNFAAKPALEAALQLERIAQEGDFERIQPAVDALEHETQRLQCVLKEWANKPDQTGPSCPATAPSSPPVASNSDLTATRG
jgi:HPt (histidine-containing phosphotransfer) domain-containing protein